MNNPFSQLKHYLADKIDPQENHATECLAACLVFSPRIRSAFIKFLSSKIKVDSASEADVVTQQTIEGGGYIDLVLEQQEKFVIAVEVKVKSPENCPHHREQLQKYRDWLGNKPDRFLFTLVRNKDETFHPEDFGANGRHTWQDLHKHLQRIRKTEVLSDVERSLIENFCNYLESEGIVSTYETKDLLNYAAGIKARKAITGIFNQVASQLKALDERYETRLIEEKDGRWWPELKIQHSDWEKIFGKGENWKISIWFVVPGVWDRTEQEGHSFCVEIELLNVEHENEWEYVKPKLPRWEKILKSKGFDWTVRQSWNKPAPTPASEIQSQPKRITSWKVGVELKATDFPANEEELVNKLVDWTRQHAEVIKSLEDGR